MKSLIIGHRGFVGSNLSRQFPGAMCAGRDEIGALAGNTFADIYCAAPQAKKWWANQNPEHDKLEVEALIKSCRRLACTGNFILFSTVDVYDPPIAVDENTTPSQESHPYGRHRYMLEQVIIDYFGAQARVLRLPALVGHGLKKNIVYDLLNDNNVSQINPNTAFQWFNLGYLHHIIKIVRDLSVGQVLNVASEPLDTRLILDTWFPQVKGLLNWDAPKAGYDVRTIHGSADTSYLFSAEDALQLHLKPYIESCWSRL